LYNLQHKDYNNNLVMDNCWKEIAGEVHAEGKEQATQYLFTTEKLTAGMRLCDTTHIMQRLYLFILVEECKSVWARLRSY